jgi:general secretion pathway protein K
MTKLANPFKILKQNSGVALLIAITTIAIVAFIAVELSYDSASEYIIASQEVNRMKARYAAKAGVEISLLRINIYKQAQQQFGSMLGNNKSMLDRIWSVPFLWPPMLPEEASGIDKTALAEAQKESFMDATYIAYISSESSKIDLTDLVSPSKALRDSTRESLTRLIDNRLLEDDDWAKENRDIRANEVINNIIDWMDNDNISLNSGDESNLYKVEDTKLPPNQPFKTMEELHMVAGMTDDLYELLAPQVTIYGVKAIQINHATKEVLMGLAPVITSDVVERINERKDSQEGPFKDKQDFMTFLQGLGINTQQLEEILPPLVFDSESNFRIQSVGTVGLTSSEIIAIVYDFDKVKEKLTESLKNDKSKQTAGGGQGQTTGTTTGTTATGTTTGGQGQQGQQQQQPATPKGRPNIVYWTES